MPAVETLGAHRLKAAIALFLLITTALLITSTAKSHAAKPVIVIKMSDMPASFAPTRTTIKAGDTVEWENTGSQLHHVTTDPSAALKKNDVSTPPGAKPFDSGFMKPGKNFSETFSVVGVWSARSTGDRAGGVADTDVGVTVHCQHDG